MQGALINALNLRQMECPWHGEKTMQKPSKYKQGEAHPQLLKRIAQQFKTQAMIHMARLSKDP
jgi:hypothetical protein